jgi:hypothetical protein
MTRKTNLHQQPQSQKFDLNIISESIVDNIEDILHHFDVESSIYNETLTGCCPVHGGDNPSAFSVLLRGVGNWRCFTHRCHEKYGTPSGAGMVSLVQALLSREKEVKFKETIDWLIDFLKINSDDATLKHDSNREFINLCKYISPKEQAENKFYPREQAIVNLKIPSQYYVGRGYKAETLYKFDIGECYNPDKEMYNRAVVPFYDESGRYMVGCSGRSIFEKCTKCEHYHNPHHRCPMMAIEKKRAKKWRHSNHFNADNYLYNLHNALPFITRTKTCILMEGPGEIWKLDEAGLYNTVATLGVKFTDSQVEILESFGVQNLILAFNNDEAGKGITQSILDRCSRLFNMRVRLPIKNDFGSSEITEIQSLFKEYV